MTKSGQYVLENFPVHYLSKEIHIYPYITEIAVPAFIFLSYAVETLKQTQVQRRRKNAKNVNGP